MFHTTLRCSMSSRLREPVWRSILDDVVCRTSRIMYLTTLFVNCHLTRLCEQGKSLPQKIDQTFFYRCSSAVSSGTSGCWAKADPELLETWNHTFKAFEGPSAKGLGQSRNECCRLLVTLFDNYNDTAMACHQKTFFHAKYRISKTHARWLAGQVRSLVEEPSIPDQYHEIWSEKYPDSFGGRSIREVVMDERAVYNQYRQTLQGKVEYRYHMLRTIDELDQERVQYRRFSLFPLHDPGRRFVPVTNSTLKDLFAANKLGDPKTIHELFDVSEFEVHGWKVQTLRTDGIQLHVVRERRIATAANTPKRRFDCCKSAAPTVVGVDPGYVNVFTAASWSEEHPSFHMSRKEFRHRAGQTAAVRQNNERRKRNPNVLSIESDWARAPVAGCVRFADCVTACACRTPSSVDRLFNFYGNRHQTRLKFHRAQKHQRTMDHVVNLFAGFDHILWGNGSDGHSPGGRSGGPVKRLVSHLTKKTKGRVTLVDEYNTSQMCCHGHGKMDRVFCRKGDRTVPVHGLFSCKSCNRIVNRDLNGALNIARLGDPGNRPTDLCRGATARRQLTGPSAASGCDSGIICGSIICTTS